MIATRTMPAGRPIGILAGLSLFALLAGIPLAAAQQSTRLEEAARWSVRSALPDGIDDWPVISEIHLQLHIDDEGRPAVLACGVLEFADPLAGRTRFLVLLDPDPPDWRQSLATPVFFGARRAEDSVPMAALCDRGDPHNTLAVPP